jgi:hypothetical protein
VKLKNSSITNARESIFISWKVRVAKSPMLERPACSEGKTEMKAIQISGERLRELVGTPSLISQAAVNVNILVDLTVLASRVARPADQPEGLQDSSRWSQTTGTRSKLIVCTLKGCETLPFGQPQNWHPFRVRAN